MGLHQVDKNARKVGGAGIWAAPALVVGAAVLIAFFGDAGREILRFSPGDIAAGELWRLLTGHLAHLGTGHLVMNLAGLGLIVFLVRDALTPGRFGLLFVASAVGIDAGFWLLGPSLEWYVGLSGVLHGILAGGLILNLSARRTESLVILVVLTTKLAWEQWAGPLPGSEASAGGSVITEAHLYGAIAGLIAGALAAVGRQSRRI